MLGFQFPTPLVKTLIRGVSQDQREATTRRKTNGPTSISYKLYTFFFDHPSPWHIHRISDIQVSPSFSFRDTSRSPSQNGPPKSYGPVTKRFSSDASSLAGNEVVEWTLFQHNSHPNSLGSVVSAGPGRTMSMDCLDNCVVTVMTSSCHNQSEPLARLSKQTDNISSAVELEWFEWKQAQ